MKERLNSNRLQLHLYTITDTTMYRIFTTGYSNKIVWYTVNEDTLKIEFQGDSEIESNLSFGAVDEVHNSIYFVHEEKQYGNFTNNGAVSRWTIKNSNGGEIPILSKQEVRDNIGLSTLLNLMLYLLRTQIYTTCKTLIFVGLSERRKCSSSCSFRY